MLAGARPVLRTLTLSAVLAAAVPALGAETPRDQEAKGPAALIDRLLADRWAKNKVEAAPLADDAEFLRRVYLDLTGKVPPVAEVRDFLDDRSPDKRSRLVDRLLKGPGYVQYFTTVWRVTWLPDNPNVEQPVPRAGFEAWLRSRLEDNVAYDQMVRELLTAPVRGGNAGPAAAAFSQALENKPENLAAATSRLFLGVKLECAQCHNHKFAPLTREQFWEFAAFFNAERREIRIPETTKTVPARFLDGSAPAWKNGVSTRVTLVDWMTTAENKYFARAAVNRLWAHFFGTGLVEPVDDFMQDPEKNELFDELAKQFADHKFDLKFLIRGLVTSRAYQLTSTLTHKSQEDGRLFARMAVKGLSPEQLFDSLAEATRFQEVAPAGPQQGRGGIASARAEFLSRFPRQIEKKTETQTSILQALAVMNGKFVGDATSLERSETLAAVADAPFLSTAERLEALYLAALTRKPRPEELDRLVKYVDQGGPSGEPKKALADVFWVLLNSSEFILNH